MFSKPRLTRHLRLVALDPRDQPRYDEFNRQRESSMRAEEDAERERRDEITRAEQRGFMLGQKAAKQLKESRHVIVCAWPSNRPVPRQPKNFMNTLTRMSRRGGRKV